MAHPLTMTICVLVALALPGFTYGRAAIDQSGRSASNTLLARDLKLADFPDHEQQKKAIAPLPRGNTSTLVKSRQKRQSDQRLAELETLITLSILSRMLTEARYMKLEPATIGRLRYATTRVTSSISLTPIVIRHRRHRAN